MHHGTVKWFNPSKGFGFIEEDNGHDIFVHATALSLESAEKLLHEGERVSFEVEQGAKGPTAEKVTRLPH